jgi:hypothetical protein
VVARPDGSRALSAFVEGELARSGHVEDVATVIVAGRECPFRCVMCDLWKGTTVGGLPPGAVTAQVRAALAPLAAARHLKLYNGGSFFDRAAVPEEDVVALARLAASFQTLVVESHPAFVDGRVLRFRELLRGDLEVAIGLETADEALLAKLNKRMTVADFARAARFLTREGVFVRTFVLLSPPFQTDAERAVADAVHAVRVAFEAGSDVAVIIPTRGGNGAMEELAAAGRFRPPTAASLLRAVVEARAAVNGGRVLADLWDVERLEGGLELLPELSRLNLHAGRTALATPS